MSVAEQDDKLAGAREQAMAQYESICAMVMDLNSNDNEIVQSARERIEEDVLSVEIRGGWHTPGDEDGNEPSEFCILLCTGGPAVRIRGELDQYCEPCRAWLECQDWFTPWTQVFHVEQDTLLAYARCFYFGEG